MKGFFFLVVLFLSFFAFGSEKLDRIDLTGTSVAGYLTISKDRPIDQSTYLYVKYGLEAFRKEKVRFVLLDLNTPGGEVFAALRISDELKKMDREYHIPVIAFVDNWALSAGALLAYSCPIIGAVSEASMGAAEPVTVGSDGKMETASEKMVSALRTEFATVASLYGRNPLIAEAMVDKDVVLVLRKGEIVKLQDNDQIIKEGPDPDYVINAKGKLLTLDAKKMQEFEISDFTVPEMSVEGSSFLAGEKLSQDPFFKNSSIRWIPYQNWKIQVFAFLSNPLVSSMLMMGVMIGLYGAVQNQGLGFTSFLGITCLALVLISSFATEIIGFLELVILFLGLILLLVDVFLLSGFGALGVLGLILFLLGMTAIVLPPMQGFSWDPTHWSISMSEWFYRLSLFLFVFLLFFFLVLPLSSFLFRKTISFKKLVLKEPEGSIEEIKEIPKIGSLGVSVSALRPFGKVEIGGIFYEAQTEGELISSYAQVEVVAYKGTFLIVREK